MLRGLFAAFGASQAMDRGFWPYCLFEPVLDESADQEEDFSALQRLVITDNQIARIEDSKPIWHRLVWHGQYHVWVAHPNSGKTAIAKTLAADLASDGFKVFLIELDASGSQLKQLQHDARECGYHIVSTLAADSSDDEVKHAFERAVRHEDLGDHVFILDTLAKFCDVNSKPESKAFYANCSEATTRGGTVLALAHAKKRAEDDLIIADGVGTPGVL